jgi:phosphatidylinositol alpha 1,6-mannosyltransferase
MALGEGVLRDARCLTHEDVGRFAMNISGLRVALFSGNYNYTRDGANLSLNSLVDFLLSQGASVRIYSPVVDEPAFPATGDLVGVPASPIPGRSEYRLVYRIGRRVTRDLNDFVPNIIHISSPEALGHWAVSYAKKHDLPVIASVHTRFDTYLRYYHAGFLERGITAILRRLYRRCDAIVVPSPSMAEILRGQRMNDDIGIWPSGVDQDVFSPAARSMEWRRELGIADDEVVVGFLGRLVLEKGLGVFCDTLDELKRRGLKLRVLVIGDGPARSWFEQRLPGAVFVGFLSGSALSRAIASMDIFFNPSVTETFGIVTLEAMSCGLPVVGADSPGTSSLVVDGVNGRLISPADITGFADAVAYYAADPEQRAIAGSAGIATASNYSWDSVNRALADNYLRVIENRTGSAPAGIEPVPSE